MTEPLSAIKKKLLSVYPDATCRKRSVKRLWRVEVSGHPLTNHGFSAQDAAWRAAWSAHSRKYMKGKIIRYKPIGSLGFVYPAVVLKRHKDDTATIQLYFTMDDAFARTEPAYDPKRIKITGR